MPRYLISFDDGAMDHIAPTDLPQVSDDTHAVVQAARDASVWVFGCGVPRQQATLVHPDGSTSDGPAAETKAIVGGFALLDTATHADALEWAARIARSCRCTQEVREIPYDPMS